MTAAETLSNPERRLPVVGGGASLGVLSIHLDGTACRVGCEFCYLGAREPLRGAARLGGEELARIEDALGRLAYDEIAVAVSEPAVRALAPLSAIVAAAARRGRPVSITTTPAALVEAPAIVEGVARVSVSVDPRKGGEAAIDPEEIGRAVAGLRAPGREVALIVSLVSPEFAARLFEGGLLRAYVERPEVDRVALHGLKPPPPWCDRAFWLRSFARIAPLLERHLDRRLFLDCYVAARILDLGPCPARPDLSPGGAFRSCVYQAAPDLRWTDAEALAASLSGFRAPATCPFPIS